MKRKTFIATFISLIFISYFYFINDCQAECRCDGQLSDRPYAECLPPVCEWTGPIPDTSAPTTLTNPLTGTTDAGSIPILLGKVINAVLGIVGSLALVMFIYGGLIWMTAAGNNEKVQKGKDILIWAAIGLIVIFTSYALVRFVFTGLGGTAAT